jgi:hypothetical protein
MKKQLVHEEIYTTEYRGSQTEIPFGDLPKNLLPTDTISIEYDEGFYSENNSWDPFTRIHIYRNREQTNTEFEEWKSWWETKKEESRKKRYDDYLRLKKEFEEGLLTKHGYRMSEEEEKKFKEYSELKFDTDARNE